MRIALVNPITQTCDRPENFWRLFGLAPTQPLPTDEELNCVALAQTMARLGHEVTLFISDAYRPRRPFSPDGSLTIRYLPTRFKFLLAPAYIPWFPTLKKEIQQGNFDVVQTSDLFQPATLLAARAHPRVFVWEEIDRYFSRWAARLLQKGHHQTIEKWLKKRVGVLPRSRAAERFLRQRGFKNIGPVLPTPVDTDTFKPLQLGGGNPLASREGSPLPTLRAFGPRCLPPPKCLGAGNESPAPRDHYTPRQAAGNPQIEGFRDEFVLVVTRLAPDRGLSFLLDVWSLVLQKRPTAKLVVLGGGSSEKIFKKEIALRRLSRSIDLFTNTLSHSQLNELYNQCAMTLITTQGGFYPFTALESLAAGKPVISSFHRALTDVIHNDQTGCLVSSAGEMAVQIAALLENPDQRREMGKRGRDFVLEYCSLTTLAGRFIAVYKK